MMPLPASGPISIGNIRTELGNTGTNSFSLAKAGQQYTAIIGDGYVPINNASTAKPNASSPFQISEWYSYDHSANRSCGVTFFTAATQIDKYYYQRFLITGCATGCAAPIRMFYSNPPPNNLSPRTDYFELHNSYPFSDTGSLTGTPVYSLALGFGSSTGPYDIDYTVSSASQVVYVVSWADDPFDVYNSGPYDVRVGCSTATPSNTPTNTITPTITQTPSPTRTPPVTPSASPTRTPQVTPSQTATPTNTPISLDCQTADFDVVLLFDESGSIPSTGFTTMMNAALNLVGKLQPYITSATSTDGFYFGVSSFGSTAVLIQSLTNNYTTLTNAITNNTQAGGTTRMDLGLNNAYSNVTGTNTRNLNKKILLYTDGDPDNETATTNEATTIKNALYNSTYRTEIITIGIGNSVNNTYLANTIASSPSMHFSVANFSSIDALNTAIANIICQPALSPTPTTTPTQTPTPTRTAAATPSQTAAPTQTPTRTAAVTPTPTSPGVQFITDPTNYNTATDACRNGVIGGTFKYLAPIYTTPQVGINVYNESTLSTLYDGGAKYHRMFRGASSWAVLIGTGGLISDVVDCTTIPSNTPTPSQTVTPSVTSSQTPASTQTPTQTPTPTGNACYNYILGPNAFSTTYFYTDCSTGIGTNQFVAANTTFGPVCSTNLPSGGASTKGSVCGALPSATPTSTPTSTPPATPPITPTQTPTPSSTGAALYTVDLYSRHGASSVTRVIEIYWSTDNINFTFAATQGNTTTCTILFPSPTIQVAPNTTIYFKVQDADLASDIFFNGANGTPNSCPGNTASTCLYSFVVTSNTSMNITAFVSTMFGTFQYC